MAYEIGTKVFGEWEIVSEIGHGAGYGAPIPVEVIDYLNRAWCFLDLSDAIDFYCGG